MPVTRDHVNLWLDGKPPENFVERFEIQRHAAQLAWEYAQSMLATGELHHPTRRSDLHHLLLQILHPFGIHEWSKILVYDPEMDRIIDPGRGRVVCRNCKPKSAA